MIKNYRYVISALGMMTSIFALAARAGSQDEALSRPAQEATCPYTIQPGDTLSEIALCLTGKAEYYPDIMRRNNLTSEVIYPGNIVRIPSQVLLPLYQCALVSPQSRSASPAPPTSAPHNATVLAEIEGMVFEDRNPNGRYDAEEPGVSGVGIILVRTGKVQTSDDQGRVVFTEVEPGEQAVGIEEATVPAGFRLCTASTVLLTLTEGDKGYAAFGVRLSTSQEPPD